MLDNDCSIRVSYSGKFLRKAVFVVFVDFATTSKIALRNLIIAYKWNDSLVNP